MKKYIVILSLLLLSIIAVSIKCYKVLTQEIDQIDYDENTTISNNLNYNTTRRFTEKNLVETLYEAETDNSTTLSASDDDYQTAYYYINTESSALNVRKNKSTSSDIIFEKSKGSLIKVIYNEDDWSYIEYLNGKFGWVKTEYLKKVNKEISQYLDRYNNYQWYLDGLGVQINCSIDSRYKYDNRMNDFYKKMRNAGYDGYTSYVYFGASDPGSSHTCLYYLDTSFVNSSADNSYGAIYFIDINLSTDSVYEVAGYHCIPVYCQNTIIKDIVSNSREAVYKEYPQTKTHDLYVYGGDDEIYIQDSTNWDFYILDYNYTVTRIANYPDAMNEYIDDFAWHE